MLYVSSIGAYVDQCEWLERATPHPSKRCAMLFSMSPRRSWRSMLTSFACEQIVQVRATEFDSKSAGPAALQLRSIAGPAAGRNREKGPSIAGVTRRLLYCSFAYSALACFR